MKTAMMCEWDRNDDKILHGMDCFVTNTKVSAAKWGNIMLTVYLKYMKMINVET